MFFIKTFITHANATTSVLSHAIGTVEKKFQTDTAGDSIILVTILEYDNDYTQVEKTYGPFVIRVGGDSRYGQLIEKTLFEVQKGTNIHNGGQNIGVIMQMEYNLHHTPITTISHELAEKYHISKECIRAFLKLDSRKISKKTKAAFLFKQITPNII